MLSIQDYPSSFFKKFPSNPGTLEYFELHVDDCIDNIAKGKEQISNQIKSVANGSNGFIHPVNYPDIISGQPITNFQPFFPNKDFIASQVRVVNYDSQLTPHPVPYPDITTGTPVGQNLNVSI